MAHAFDTQAAKPQRTLLVEGAQQLLSPLLITNGGYVATIVPFGAVVRSYTDVDGVKMLYDALAGQAPAIAIATGNRASRPAGNVGYKQFAELELLVYFVSNHMRGLFAGRMSLDAAGIASNTADPGLHVMMEHAEELLAGKRADSSTSLKEIRPDREEELATLEDVTIWLQTYQVTMNRPIDRHRDVVDRIRSIATLLHPSDGPAADPQGNTEFVTEITEAAP